MASSGIVDRTDIICSDELRAQQKAERDILLQKFRFNKENDQQVLRRLPTLFTNTDDVEYFYLKSSCRQAARRISDGALASNIDQESGLEKDEDTDDIVDGQFVDRSQNTPCSNTVLGIGKSTRDIYRMRRKAEVLKYNKQSNK